MELPPSLARSNDPLFTDDEELAELRARLRVAVILLALTVTLILVFTLRQIHAMEGTIRWTQ